MADEKTLSRAQELIDRAYMGIIGIDKRGHVYGGSDQSFPHADNGFTQEEWHEDALTPHERVELADEMIRRWTEYRSQAQRPAPASPDAQG